MQSYPDIQATIQEALGKHTLTGIFFVDILWYGFIFIYWQVKVCNNINNNNNNFNNKNVISNDDDNNNTDNNNNNTAK